MFKDIHRILSEPETAQALGATEEELCRFCEPRIKSYPDKFMQFHLDWAVQHEYYLLAILFRDEMALRDNPDIIVEE